MTDDLAWHNAINWDDPSEVGARIVSQFANCLAIKIAAAELDGTYEQLVSGYREGRATFGVKCDGMTVLEDAPLPPPSGN
jgi:hypothetical protein